MHALTDSLQATHFLAANLYYTYRFVHAYSVLMLCAFTVLRVGYFIKVGTLFRTIIGFPIGNVWEMYSKLSYQVICSVIC